MVHSPKIVVLDEPNANLDAEGDDALARAITSLRAAGSTVVVIAHRPSALAAVNKVMVMQNGMILRFGEKDEVLAATTQNHSTAPAHDGTGRRSMPRRAGQATVTPSPAAPVNGSTPLGSVGIPARSLPVSAIKAVRPTPPNRSEAHLPHGRDGHIGHETSTEAEMPQTPSTRPLGQTAQKAAS